MRTREISLPVRGRPRSRAAGLRASKSVATQFTGRVHGTARPARAVYVPCNATADRRFPSLMRRCTLVPRPVHGPGRRVYCGRQL